MTTTDDQADRLSTIAVDAPVPAAAAVFVDADVDVRTDYAAAWVAEALRDVLARQDRAVLALVGGSEVARAHAALVDQDVDWSRVVVTQGDERAVPAESAHRNWRVIEPLVDPLLADGRLPVDNVVALPDLPAGATPADVEAALDDMRSRVDHVDVALLAAGPDGHCASLFPGHPGLEATGTFTVVDDSPKPPPLRMSVTVGTLAGADASLLLVSGDDKATAAAAIAAGGSLSGAPGRVVHLARRGVIVTDRVPEAGSA